MITEVITKDVNYDRTGYLKLENNKVIFDTSDKEYGPVEFDLQLLEQKIKEHNAKI